MESKNRIDCTGRIEGTEEDVRHELFRETCKELHALHVEKDTRYNGSFHRTFEKYGIVASAIRLSDKVERLEQLVLNPSLDPLDESIEDTLRDVANYAIMTLVELRLERSGL